MICPACSTHIPDGSVICPACHASVGMTMAMPVLQGRWCPSCGVSVDWEDEVCPNCGLPMERAWGQPIPQSQQAALLTVEEMTPDEQVEIEEQDTKVIPRIESALPAENDPTSKVAIHEAMPRIRGMLLAGVASIALIGGAALALSHPWNPDAYSTRATEEADTSMAGFPGTVESLSGQDSNDGAPVEVLSGDDATYAELVEAYNKLAKYEERANESETLFLEVAFGDDLDEQARGKRELDALAIDVSNLIEGLEQIDVTSGTYVDQRDNLLTLANWMRNRVDTLGAAWKADVESADAAADQESLMALLTKDNDDSGQSTYKTLFDEHYEEWKPEVQEESE